MKYVLNLNKISKKDTAIAGGKGASLGEMLQARIPVPPGFVVLADANLIEAKNEILAEFKKLKTKYVAVRSSATAEDSLSASWAGQLETYLNVGEKDLLKSIEKCRASINSPRAISYRKQKGFESAKGGPASGGKISVAVVIQKMIQPEISGVCFTANPVTGNRNEMVIEAGRGLGEKIVGGKITPKTYTISKKSTGVGHPYAKLVRICLRIEKLFKYSQDIEWAFAEGRFYILQSRPITTFTGNWGDGLDYLLKDYWSDLDKIVEDNYYGRHNKKLINSLFPKVFSALQKAVLIMEKSGSWIEKARVIQKFGALAKSLNEKVVFIDSVTQFLRETSMEDVKIIKTKRREEMREKINVREIKGVVASAGGSLKVIRGIAKIIFNENDFSKIKKGDILIAKETSSDFLPAIIKAKAMVTDLGGILCHAAIVARELKIPCVVGTKIATRILKNGDFIEIDLKSGAVKVIKRR